MANLPFSGQASAPVEQASMAPLSSAPQRVSLIDDLENATASLASEIEKLAAQLHPVTTPVVMSAGGSPDHEPQSRGREVHFGLLYLVDRVREIQQLVEI